MRDKKIKLNFLLLVLGLTAQAQESTNATGGEATGIGGIVSYSVGQVLYNTTSNTFGTVNQGVQQSYEIFMVGITETNLNILLSVFPNPTADNLTLSISNYNNEKLSYQLYDIQGKLLNNGQITSYLTQINTISLPSAAYLFFVVNQENKKVQSFKIIKK